MMNLFSSKPNSSWNDSMLLNAVLRNDRDAIVYMFYEKFSATFQYHIYKLFSYKVEISDMVDEFFLYLFENDWKRLRSFDETKASLATWISTVSYRFFRDYKRSKIDSNGKISINDKWESVRGDWVQCYDAGLMADISTAIDGIQNERDRKIAGRIFIEDREYESVADEFGLTVDYVYTVKNRILKKIKKCLEDYN